MIFTRSYTRSQTDELNNIETEEPSQTTNMNIKLPQFTDDNPDLFFKIIDSIKFNYKVNESELFLNLFQNLPYNVQALSKHLLETNAKDHIAELKKIVDTQYKLPIEERIKKLILSAKIGDMKPSQYLTYIRDILGEEAVNHKSLIRNHFLESLPNNVAPFVNLFSKDCDLDEIALAADKSYPQNNSVNQIKPGRNSLEDKLELLDAKISNISQANLPEMNSFRRDIETQITQMMHQIAITNQNLKDLQDSFYSSGRSRYRSQSNQNRFNNNRSRSYERRPSARAPGVCYFHQKFKENALKCNKPCVYYQSFQQNSYKTSNNASGNA